METTRLGNSELRVSRLGLGGCPLGGHDWGTVDDAQSIRTVQAALDAGINFFDTADVYGLGHSEQILADALGPARHEVVIASKFGVRWDAEKNIVKDISPGYLRQALEASLRRLRVDCISLYYVHWPDGTTPVEAAIEELEACRQAGKIQAIGVSNFSGEQILRSAQVADIAAVQVQLSLINREALSLAGVLRSTGASLVTWGSLAQGLLTGKYDANHRFGDDDRRRRYADFQGERLTQNLGVVEVLKQVAKRNHRTPAQVAMRWLLDTHGVDCVLFGAKSPQQTQDNTGAEGWSLSPADYAALSSSLQPPFRAAG